jgi:hypothetical protein
MGMIGGILRSTSGNGVNVVSKVKNKELQKLIDQSVADYSGFSKENNAALSDYISKYLAGEGDAKARTAQETGAVDEFYNGTMANRLSALRANRAKAVNDAADFAAKQGLRSVNQSRVGGDGSGSSYEQRLAISATMAPRVQAAVDNANQERSDLGWITQNELNLAGRRQQMANAQAAYGLVPSEARAANYRQNLGILGNLGQLDQLNKFYGLKQPSNKWADIADSMDQGIMNAASIYSSVGGGGGGMSKGGPVRGPGTETSDSIPVHLSDGEFVMPAASMKIPGVRPLMEYIRHIGLVVSGQHHKAARHMADGGMVWSNSISNPFDNGFDFGSGAGASDSVGFNPTGFSQVGGGGAKKGGGGGGGSGLSAQAMALQARVDKDLGMPQFMGPTTSFGTEIQDNADTSGLDLNGIMKQLLSDNQPQQQAPNIPNERTPSVMLNPNYQPPEPMKRQQPLIGTDWESILNN